MTLIHAVNQLEELSDNSIKFQESLEVLPLTNAIELLEDIYKDFKNKNTFDVNIKIIDIEPFSILINILKENINLLPTELKDKLLEILDK